VRCQTYDYLPSHEASLPFDWYQIILLGEQKHMCVNNLPKVATWQCTEPELIQGPFSHQSKLVTITLPSHTHEKLASSCLKVSI